MYRIQWLRFVPVAVIVGFALIGRPAHADDWSNFALVGCDATANMVDVQEISVNGDQETYPAPGGYQSKWLGSLVKYISPPEGVPDDATHGTYRKKIGDWKVSCKLKGNVYLIVVSPWSLNNMVMGQCGPGGPDLELTVYRNGRLLVRNLRFSYTGECMQDNNLAFFLRVKLSEMNRVVTIGDISPKAPEFNISYSQMPKFDQRNSAALKYKPN